MPCSRKDALESFSISASSSAKMSSSSSSVGGVRELVLGSFSRATREATFASSAGMFAADTIGEWYEDLAEGRMRMTSSLQCVRGRAGVAH